MQENLGLRLKIDELQEEKMQLKGNLKIHKDTIQKLTASISQNALLKSSSSGLPNHVDYLIDSIREYNDGQMQASDKFKEAIGNEQTKKRNVSIKDKIV